MTWRTMAICGAGRGLGVTHLAVWAANYLVGVRGERTAVLEWNSHQDFDRICRFCNGSSSNPLERFQILGVDYYAGAGAEQLSECLNGDYRRILIDYGENAGQRLLDCSRCDRKVLMGSLSEWQAEVFLEMLRDRKKRDGSWNYAIVFGSEEARRQIEKEFRISLWRIPASFDAFAITRADMDFFAGFFMD